MLLHLRIVHVVIGDRFVGAEGDVHGQVCGHVVVEPPPQFTAQRAGRGISGGFQGWWLACVRREGGPVL